MFVRLSGAVAPLRCRSPHERRSDPKASEVARIRDGSRRIKEAVEAIIACEGAISRAPDDVARSIFERSERIWRKQLAALRL
jgi:hypothetical protein